VCNDRSQHSTLNIKSADFDKCIVFLYNMGKLVENGFVSVILRPVKKTRKVAISSDKSVRPSVHK